MHDGNVGSQLTDGDLVQGHDGPREYPAEAVGVVVLDLGTRLPPEAHHVDEIGVLREETRQGIRVGGIPGRGEASGDLRR